MELKCRVARVLPIEKGTSKSSGKEWQKASIVVETPGQYPKKILLTNFKKAEEFAKMPVGADMIFHIDIESREWTNQTTGRTSWFTEVGCWKWEAATQVMQQVQPMMQQPMNQYAAAAMPQSQPNVQPSMPQGDDLPF